MNNITGDMCTYKRLKNMKLVKKNNVEFEWGWNNSWTWKISFLRCCVIVFKHSYLCDWNWNHPFSVSVYQICCYYFSVSPFQVLTRKKLGNFQMPLKTLMSECTILLSKNSLALLSFVSEYFKMCNNFSNNSLNSVVRAH